MTAPECPHDGDPHTWAQVTPRPVIPPSREQRDHIAKMAAIGRAVAAAKRLHPSAGAVA